MTTYYLSPTSKVPVVRPGDQIFFTRGQKYPKTVINGVGTAEQPVVIRSIGNGAYPQFKGLELKAPFTFAEDIYGTQAAWAGIVLGAPFCSITRGFFSDSVTGIHFASDHCTASEVKCRKNTKMSVNTPSPNYDDSGAFGVLINGDGNTLYRAQIDGHIADSYDFGKDGSAIELYDASYTMIDSVISLDNETFIELGGKTVHTEISDSSVISKLANSKGLVTRGAKDQFGPVVGTSMERVGMYLTGAGSKGVVTFGGTTKDTLSVKNSVIMAEQALWSDGPFIDEGNLWIGKETRNG